MWKFCRKWKYLSCANMAYESEENPIKQYILLQQFQWLLMLIVGFKFIVFSFPSMCFNKVQVCLLLLQLPFPSSPLPPTVPSPLSKDPFRRPTAQTKFSLTAGRGRHFRTLPWHSWIEIESLTIKNSLGLPNPLILHSLRPFGFSNVEWHAKWGGPSAGAIRQAADAIAHFSFSHSNFSQWRHFPPRGSFYFRQFYESFWKGKKHHIWWGIAQKGHERSWPQCFSRHHPHFASSKIQTLLWWKTAKRVLNQHSKKRWLPLCCSSDCWWLHWMNGCVGTFHWHSQLVNHTFCIRSFCFPSGHPFCFAPTSICIKITWRGNWSTQKKSEKKTL